MIFKFKSVELSGFMSYDHECIKLDNLGLVRIIGKNNYDAKSRSNGSGKSSILSAILWCLTGKTERGTTDVANSILNRGALVKLELSIDSVDYSITRTKDHEKWGSGLWIYEGDKDISGSTKTKTASILSNIMNKMDYSMMTSIILLSQGLPSRLSNLSPSARKGKLEELSDNESFINSLKMKIDSAKSKIMTQLSSINNDIVKLESENSSESRHIANNTIKLNDIISHRADSITREEYDKLNNELNDIRDQLLSITKQLNNDKSAKNLLEVKSHQMELANRDMSKQNKEYHAQYITTKNAECPTCHQSIAGDISKEIINRIKSKVSNNQAKMRDNLAKIDENSIKINELTQSISDNSSRYDDLQSKSDAVVKKLATYVNASDDTEKLLADQIENSNKIIESNKEKLVIFSESKQKYDEKMEICKWIESQLSRKFRSYLLEGIIDFFNNKSKEYSPYLFEKSVVKLAINGNNIDIYLNDRNFSNLSSGEARRVDIILQLIERDLARSEAGIVSNILVIDEILDSLDDLGINGVMRLIELKSPDVSTIMLVSHKNDIEVATDIILTVEKGTDQISHITKGLEYVK